MKKLILLSIVILSFTSIISAQSYMYVGNDRYPSTETWELHSLEGGDLEVTIGRDGSKGLVMLQRGVISRSSYIGGNVYIFLSDGSRITCTDKNIRDHVNNKSVAIYKLTSTEVERMKTNYITQIRFTILPSSDGNPFNGTKTVDNIVYDSFYSEKYNRVIHGIISHYKTEDAITELFK